jgi:hypothetical protein
MARGKSVLPINNQKLVDIRKYGKAAVGRAELIRHYSGKPMTYRQMCLAFCYDCMAGYADGKKDCGVITCPLYHQMPFRKNPEQQVPTEE